MFGKNTCWVSVRTCFQWANNWSRACGALVGANWWAWSVSLRPWQEVHTRTLASRFGK